MSLLRIGRPRGEDFRSDASAAVVLGIESVPDGLASGVLAGVNPVAGLYAYMFGVASAALFTSTAVMAVQGTGAMAIIIRDAGIGNSADPAGTLVALSLLTGAVMITCGWLRLSRMLRFVASSVMTGFITAVGVNIVLGQLGDLTGYAGEGSTRLSRSVDIVFHPGRIDFWTLVVGLATIGLVVTLRATRLRSLGLVVAILLGSALGNYLRSTGRVIAVVGDVADVPNGLPGPVLPDFADLLGLLFPAISLAFVGLVQGAAVSAAFGGPNARADGADADFVGQGVGNVVAGVFQGMPVGGSMSASSLAAGAGARSRWALIYTAVVMAVVITAAADLVEAIALPALAGLLVVIGAETVKPHQIHGAIRTGSVPAATMAMTFFLTLVIPLQYAVLVGVGMSMLMYVVGQSYRIETRRLVFGDGHSIDEVEPPRTLPPCDVVMLQPYGSLFFGAAATLTDQLPTVTDQSHGSVVILRLRGKPELGTTILEALEAYAHSLTAAGSKLVIVTDSDRIRNQIVTTGVIPAIGAENVYRGERRLFAALETAYDDAMVWVDERCG